MSVSPNRKQKLCRIHDSSGSDDSGILNERILVLVLHCIKWDIHVLCQMASVCRKLRAVAKRLLWRELCVYRAPRMMTALIDGAPGSTRVGGGGWHSMAKLLFFCCGCHSTPHFKVKENLSGHFVKESRFSKTSGRSFLVKKCRNDVLYVSDPCEHTTAADRDDLGIYRGVFGGFMKSKTRACLIGRRVALEELVRCPYCGARVWSMTTARLIPKSAERRLGARDKGIEFFVCVNGHLHGSCWLVPLSDDDDDENGLDSEYDDQTGDDDEPEENGTMNGEFPH
ncbi:OLC1v1007342C1 [Oldenlandia corymbosa var. corymbosa]|uniref:OLC1v1007342C1 n=1 Tax=Oldenlandia corymbosa var. corymbosa TaxID=529605 RepID=A0AAV1DLE3_OLDCO|nr:OLC1v1007342C1 [Oldenlandia corymbosa var. corymbosa]